jgi:hypothetical protein
VGLFRRAKPLHERLAEEGALDIGARQAEPSRLGGLLHAAGGGGFLLGPPDAFGNPSPLGEVGFHGVARPRRWDAVATAEAELPGEEVHFVALPDGTLLVDENVPDGSLSPLADALEETLTPPYRAQGIRQGQSVWAVAGTRIEVRDVPGHDGDELEVVEGETVVLGRRLDGDLFEIETTQL